MQVKEYMIPVYALLVRADRRTIESLPEPYQVPVAEHLVEKIEVIK